MFSSQNSQVSNNVNYIEDVFSTYLYTGNGSTQTITNGIDLAGKGGLVWIKKRTFTVVGDHRLFDTARTADGGYLVTNNTGAQSGSGSGFSFDSTGFTYGYGNSGETLVSWTFRKQAKFFDVVTYTGDGTTSRNIPHSLGSTPGCIIVKATNANDDWYVYHRGCSTNNVLYLNLTNAQTSSTMFGTPTSTDFVVTTGGAALNVNGRQYVAYLFAHNAGGFGLTGTDNVISCGSFVTTSGTNNITLGYEPQWLLVKPSSAASSWFMFDNMRGMVVNTTGDKYLEPNSSNAEASAANFFDINATGFNESFGGAFGSGVTCIYIAIRRGPMKVPTLGTSVFSPNVQTGAGTTAGQTLTTSFPVDLEISEGRATNSGAYFLDRLRGGQNYMTSVSTAAEVNFTGYTPLISFANNTGILDANYGSTSNAYVAWNFRRAPGFFDEVCYTGTGVARTLNHNLAAVPELMIVKRRDGTSYGDWLVYHSALGNTKYLLLNTTQASTTANSGAWNFTNPTSTQFTVGDWESLTSTATYVAYLFATVAGVSKVGSYTGTGALQTVACGFTSGARFVLVKATSTTGDWYVWDSARGISSSTDPYLLLNSTAAEVTSTNWVDTDSTGFKLTAESGNNVNTNGTSYIFLAIS